MWRQKLVVGGLFCECYCDILLYVLAAWKIGMIAKYCDKYEELVKNRGYVIKVTPLPKYISAFLPDESEVILIHKLDTSRERSQLRVTNAHHDSLEESEVIGQPLECPFSPDDGFDSTVFSSKLNIGFSEEDTHAPLSLDEARECICLSNLKIKPPIPLWVLTLPTETDRTVLLGTHIQSGWFIRSWACYLPYRMEMEEMIEEHCKLSTLFKHQIKYDITCLINVKKSDDLTALKETSAGQVALEVKWQEPTYEVPISKADTTLILKTIIGNEESPTLMLWKQLLLLNGYLETAVKWKQDRQQQMPYQSTTVLLPSSRSILNLQCGEKSSEPLQDRILKLMRASEFHPGESSSCDETFGLQRIINDVTADKCVGRDFIDKLWYLLIEASTYQELATCVQLVFHEYKRLTVKPFIASKNTRLAEALNFLKSNSGITTQLMLEPLELLIEIGIEKLRKDYVYIFMLSQLVTQNSLTVPSQKSFSEIPPEMWETSVNTLLTWLARIHVALDLMCLTQSELSVDMSVLMPVTNIVLKEYLGPSSPIQSIKSLIQQPKIEIRAPVKTKDVEYHISVDGPYEKWLLKMATNTGSRSVTTVFLTMLNSPFPESLRKSNVTCLDFTTCQSPQFCAQLNFVADKLL